jgi:O-antigen/teichoic acid export membrane protein
VVLFIRGEFGLIKEYLSSTKWLITYFFTLAAFQNLSVFMLSHLSIEEELANYGVAFRYYSIALLLLGSINAVLLPKFSKVEMQDIKRQRMFTLRWLRNMVWLIMPLVITALIGKPLFIWINGNQYEKAFYIFVVFSVGIWLSLMFSPLVNILMSRKEFRFLFIISAVAFILNFTGNYILVPIWGGFGAALVTILSHNLLIQGLILVKVFKGS